jgi:GMP synthase (glutamine-hydrolysing)
VIDLTAPDLLVLMGGPMGVYECATHGWMADEIERVARRITLGRRTLGVCLGAQIVAAAMGARVHAGPVQEIGFAPVSLTAGGMTSPLRHLASVPVLHWHGDTFDLPEDAELLASTPAYSHQAFRRGLSLLALQFHAEMGEESGFEAWLECSGADMPDAGISAAALREEYTRLGHAAVAAGRRMIAEWLGETDV